MNTSKQSFITSVLPAVTGVFLVLGISMVVGTTTALKAQSIIFDDVSSFSQGRVPEDMLQKQLKPAAPVAYADPEQAGRVLFTGMLLILAALLLYTVYVVRLQREAMERTPWHRMQRWFERHLDRRTWYMR